MCVDDLGDILKENLRIHLDRHSLHYIVGKS